MWAPFKSMILAGRRARRSPGFTAVAVISLGVGIGVATSVLSIGQEVLGRAMPYTQPDRIVHLWEANERNQGDVREFSWPEFLDLRDGAEGFDRVAGYGYSGAFRIDTDEGPSRMTGAMVTVDFFDVLGVQPEIGRTFREPEEAVGSPRVAVLSHETWINRFGESPDAVGSLLMLEGTPVEIVGVLPREFHFALSGTPDIWVAIVPSETQRERRYMHWVKVIARLPSDATLQQAADATRTMVQSFHEADPANGLPTPVVIPLSEQIRGEIRPIVIALVVAGGLVLLVTIVNVANLLISRSLARQGEIATRVALGGTGSRIAAQFVSEGAILGLSGVVVGVAVAKIATFLLIASIPDRVLTSMPYLRDMSLDVRVLVIAVATSVLATLFFASISAWHAVRTVGAATRLSGRRVVSGGDRLRTVLVALEIGLSCTLVIGSGLLYRSVRTVVETNPGFDRHNLLTMKAELPEMGYEDEQSRTEFFDRAIARLEQREGIESVVLVNKLPLSGFGDTGGPKLVGRPAPPTIVSANIRGVSAGYFETMRIPILEGRTFTRDDTPERPLVALVSESLARRLLPGRSVIGERMQFVFLDEAVEIVGVVGDENVGALDVEAEPMVYFSYRQEPGPSWYLVVRTTDDPSRLAGDVTAELRGMEPELLVHSVRSMDELVETSQAVFMRSYPLKLIGTFGSIALFLSAIGVFGIVAYSVSLRTREFGIRLVLGANRATLFALVMRRALMIASAGALVGLVMSIPMTRLVGRLLVGVDRHDPLTWTVSAAILALAVFAASVAPAVRAAGTDPAEALRHDS